MRQFFFNQASPARRAAAPGVLNSRPGIQLASGGPGLINLDPAPSALRLYTLNVRGLTAHKLLTLMRWSKEHTLSF